MLGSEDPAAVDQRSTAVVASVGLQADRPGPGEGAGLGHVAHRHLTVLGHGESSEAWSLLTAGVMLRPTPVLYRPGETS